MRLTLISTVVLGCVVVVLIVVSGVGEDVSSRPTSQQQESPSREEFLDVPVARVVGSASQDPNELRSRGVVSSSASRQTLLFESGGSFVRVRSVERSGQVAAVDPGSFALFQFDESETEFATSYQVFDVGGRQSTELYVLGRSAGGECIVEKWLTSTATGAYFFSRAASAVAVGVPVPGLPGTEIGVQGGTYVPPAQRQPRRQQRIEILRTAEIGNPQALACDPEGRFLLLVCGDAPRTLYRLELAPGGSLVPVLDSAIMPHMEYWQSIYPSHHAQYGRVYVAGCGGCANVGALSTSLLFDNNNDGVVDQHQTLTLDQVVSAGYAGDVWVSDFLQY